jgi:NCS1 family nucleobase:cation symporter-1
MGGIVRMVASARQAAWPAMLCMGLPTGVISLIGLYSALVTGDADPTAWLISFGGLKYGILGLLFLGIANIGTAVIGAYVASIGFKQIPYVQGKLSWNWITFLVFLPAALIAVSIPKLFFDGIGTFMAFLGVFFAPIAGIQIADYFFLRKQRLSVLGLYDNSTNSPYYFLGGVNPAAVVGMLCGFATYVYLLHPVSYATHFPFQYLSASLPALVVAALAYFTLSKLFIVNSKLGDYGKRGVADSNSRR